MTTYPVLVPEALCRFSPGFQPGDCAEPNHVNDHHRTTVTMPQLGESVTEGMVGNWLKEVGERIEKYDPLCEVTTDKVNSEIPSPVSGVLVEILVDPDDGAGRCRDLRHRRGRRVGRSRDGSRQSAVGSCWLMTENGKRKTGQQAKWL